MNNLINKDFLKQVHRKINAKNCTFPPHLVVILNSKEKSNRSFAVDLLFAALLKSPEQNELIAMQQKANQTRRIV